MFYFVLGVLSVLVLILIGILIYGMVTVSRLTRSSKASEQDLQRQFEQIYNRLDSSTREIYVDLDKFKIEFDQKLKNLYSYTDSRIDKSLSEKH